MPKPNSRPTRRLVTRREQRRYACGCSTTRIESYWQAEDAEVCQAHGGALLRSSVAYQPAGQAQAAASPQSE